MIEFCNTLKAKMTDEDLTDYSAIPFWSWNNELEESVLLKQIEDMKSAGMGGFIMHARTGLKTEYLGKKWFSCIGACLKKAKELKMNAWIYDENGWPSGFVGGKLLEKEEYRAKFLRYCVKETFDNEAFAIYVENKMGFERVYENKQGESVYHCIYLMTSPANTDILNPKVTEEFIRLTHEEYYKRFSESFGKELVGFFTDEPQYYRNETPYTSQVEKVFAEKYNEDVLDGLVYLFLQDERGYIFREKYYQTLNELYVKNFYKKLYDWCETHHCKLTGHSVEENGLANQMVGGAGVMPTYEYEHIPGIDDLGRNYATELSAKQVGSVASQLGKKQVLTETFGCAGYDVTPEELKSIGEYQFFNGVNLMCHHLYPYSIAGQGKVDHPPVFSPQSNWWKGFRSFNDYFTRLGYIVANTKENYDVLVIHPMRSTYLRYVRANHEKSVQDLEEKFAALLKKLRMHGIQYQLADETLLAKYGSVKDDKLTIGNCTYDKIIIPDMFNISRTTVDILAKYTGILWLEGALEYIDGEKTGVGLSSNITFDELIKNAKINFYSADGNGGMTSRCGHLGEFIFIKNYSPVYEPKDIFVETKGVTDNYKALNLEDFTLQNIDDIIKIPANGSVILFRCDGVKTTAKKSETVMNITNRFSVSGITENYLVLDYAQMSYDGSEYSERMPLPGLMENLLRADYRGKLFIKQTFAVKTATKMRLMMEKGNILSASVNGWEVRFENSDFDALFVETDISDKVRIGENEFVYEIDYYQHDGVHFALFDPLATESLRNCLYYDTHIENAFIKGDFVLDENLCISKKTGVLPITKLLYEHGYPFFKGELYLDGEYDFDGKGERELWLDGRFAMAEIYINGVRVEFTLSYRRSITQYLRKGKNSIIIKVFSSLRNLLGPHHFAVAKEPLGVGPFAFTMRGSWGNKQSKYYTPDYNSVPFGVENILVVENKS